MQPNNEIVNQLISMRMLIRRKENAYAGMTKIKINKNEKELLVLVYYILFICFNCDFFY